MGIDAKTALSIYVVAQLVTFGVFIYLMTTVNPKQINEDSKSTSATESVVRLLRTNHSTTPSTVNNVTTTENITKPSKIKHKVKTFRRTGISSDNDEATRIMNAPLILPKSHVLCPLHRDGKDMVAIISNSSTPFLHHTEDNICNKSSCVYRLVTTTDTDLDQDQDIMHQIRFGRLFPPVHGKHPVKGFRRSLKENDKGEVEKDTVLLRFLGIDHDGAPIIEIRVGQNLVIANPISGRDASFIKWVPYTTDTSNDTFEHAKYETCKYIDDAMKINNSLSVIEFTNVTENLTKDFRKDRNSTNITQFFTEVLEDVKNIISTRLIAENNTEFNENSTAINDSKYFNDTDLVLEIEADPHKSDSRDYEINFGSSSELPIINRTGPKLQPDIELFLLNSTAESLSSLHVEKESLSSLEVEHITEKTTNSSFLNIFTENFTQTTRHPTFDTNSKLNIFVENSTETSAGNTTMNTSLTIENNTNETQSFSSNHVETINVSEKVKNISIHVENNTLANV